MGLIEIQSQFTIISTYMFIINNTINSTYVLFFSIYQGKNYWKYKKNTYFLIH